MDHSYESCILDLKEALGDIRRAIDAANIYRKISLNHITDITLIGLRIEQVIKQIEKDAHAQ